MAITHSIADTIVKAAILHGRRQDVTAAAVVCDLAGNPVATARDERAGPVNLVAAGSKAATAANFGATSEDVFAVVKGDEFLNDSVIATPPLSLLPGGAPIILDGRVVGGLGIAGGHYSQDHTIALQALADWTRALRHADPRFAFKSNADAPQSNFYGKNVIVTGARGGSVS
ncbi:GlcG/HbpS family heme-binding protein [Sphingobium sp. SCG-1]|uniref:GlcG/HbpS family heme-binding protein n=1 Tax=Sphingobium sp. SCG-1 TaxID=2072936 RepID=UPI001CB99921|nr:heme-binding protein [Sphingobium sp. SCG-1]